MLLIACNSTPKSPPKVYDCFLFFNEIEMLHIRLAELYDHVDHFVLIEARETFRGNPKTCTFEERKQEFAPYLDKIIHVTIDEPFATVNPWEREYHQRDQILRGLTHCRPHDVILISDADEITRATHIPKITEALKTHQIAVCKQAMSIFYLNRRTQDPWPGTMATTYKQLRCTKPHELRKCRKLSPKKLKRYRIKTALSIPNAGWHFNSMGGIERHRQKLAAFSHIEYDTPKWRRFETLRAFADTLDLVPIDDTYPIEIFTRMEKYQYLCDQNP